MMPRYHKLKVLLFVFITISTCLKGQVTFENLIVDINQATMRQKQRDAAIFAAYGETPYVAHQLDPTLTFDIAKNKFRILVKKFLLRRGKQPAYYNEITGQSFNRVKNVMVTDDYLRFTKNNPKTKEDTVVLYFKDILNTPVIYFTPFRNGVSAYTKVSGHVFGSTIREFPDVIFAIQHYYALQYYPKEIEKFKATAEKLRENSEKNKLSEEQRKHFVQAKSQAEAGNYDKAIQLYEKGIAMNPAAYTGAYFNLALIASLAEYYPYAIYRMKQYLLLEPDAKDKGMALDKIYEWEIQTHP